MQTAYEERLARMQSAYDELNGQLVIAQERFLASTRELEARHRQITEILSHKEAANRDLNEMRSKVAKTVKQSKNERENEVLMAIANLAGAPRVSKVETKSSEAVNLEGGDESGAEHGALGLASFLNLGLEGPEGNENDPIYVRLERLEQSQKSVINAMEETTDRQIRELESVIAMTDTIGLDKVADAGDGEGYTGAGGPFFELAGGALAGSEAEDQLNRQLYRIGRNLDRMSKLQKSIMELPLAEPLAAYSSTSGFGPRVDPFNKRMAFHAGLDMAAYYNAPVYATGSGVVTYASRKGPYGRLVEIDHGNGFKTRFGHLNAIKVKVGQKVEFRDVVGLVGSSGRSTGPHLHYEVWYKGKVRNPSNLIEAGRYVFTHQG